MGDIKITNCIACNSDLIKQSLADGDRMSYDYFCNSSCKKMIVISDLVLLSDFLDEIKKNRHLQKELQDDIRNWNGDEYKVTTSVTEFFRGVTYEDKYPIDYDVWDQGQLPGYPNRYKHLEEEELSKINQKQKEIFFEKVDKQLAEVKERFDKSMSNSINPEKLIRLEINGVKELLSNSKLNQGNLQFGTFKISDVFAREIRKKLNQLITGSADFNTIIHPKIKSLIGSQGFEQRTLIDGATFPKYLDYLETLVSDKESYTGEEQNELLEKIGEVLEKVNKLEFGQEIIYNEIESLKNQSSKLSKKDFKQLVIGKLFDLGSKNLINTEFAQSVMKSLFGEDFKLLGG